MRQNWTKTAVILAMLIGVMVAATLDIQALAPQAVRSYIFGHSLLVHSPPAIPTPSDETTVPHWLHFLADASGHTYAVDGQYGFLPQHAMLPPTPQWGFEHVNGVWDGDSGDTFADADFNVVLLTAANFIQYQPATVPYDGDNPTQQTPLGATLTIIDWVQAQEPDAEIFIYENWPDMAGFLSGGWPPTQQQFANYNAYVTGDFHAWWVTYSAEIESARPNAPVTMIPVGPIITTLQTDPMLANVPLLEWYEDDAPHGRPSLYFLAALITYMAIYDEQPADEFVVPTTVHEDVRNNYAAIVDAAWDELAEAGVVNELPTAVQLRDAHPSHIPTATTASIMLVAITAGLYLWHRRTA